MGYRAVYGETLFHIQRVGVVAYATSKKPLPYVEEFFLPLVEQGDKGAEDTIQRWREHLECESRLFLLNELGRFTNAQVASCFAIAALAETDH